MPIPRFASRFPTLAVHAALGVQGGMLLYAAGRPLFTDDLWWHLSRGRAYLENGPALAAAPTLHTAAGPPDAASWLADVLLYLLQAQLGFGALRLFHVLAVLGILALAWWLLERASGSRWLASLGTSCFGALAAYRLFQLRPELFSMASALVLYALLLEGEKPPSRFRVACAAGLTALWANLHAGFVLGPILVLAGALGVALSFPLLAEPARGEARARMLRLFAAFAACLLASFANPEGYAAYLPYISAGASTPDLRLVFDEWAPFAPFDFPAYDVQPSPLTFLLTWALFVFALLLCGGRALRVFGHGRRGAGLPWDPVLVALAGASFCAIGLAVRFLWLGVFPLLLIFDTLRRRDSRGLRVSSVPLRWGIAAMAVLLVLGFQRAGDWPFLSRGVPGNWERYAEPYSKGKYPLHAAWLLSDAGVSGKLYNAYHQGGFLGFWLSPRLQTFVDGSLNVAPGVMESYAALQARSGLSEEDGFLDLLDRYEVDFFLGTGMPSVQHPTRPWRYTVAYLEGEEAWIPIFRSARSALYLRDVPRNQENLRRLADYYRQQGIPFDVDEGFDAGRVLDRAPRWASRHGLLPRDYPQALRQQRVAEPRAARDARARLSGIFAMLGLYERVVGLEARTLSLDPADTSSRRRLVWALLRLGRIEEARAQSERLGALGELDPLTDFVARSAREISELAEPARRAERIAMLPVFSRAEANWHASGYSPPELRIAPDASHASPAEVPGEPKDDVPLR